MFDVSIYLGREDVVGHKLDEVMWGWNPEILAEMKKEPAIIPDVAKEIVTEWRWE